MRGRKKEKAHVGKPALPPCRKQLEWAGARPPILIVLSFCLVFAVHLGALQPELHFQKAGVENGGIAGGGYAYASGNALLFKLPHAESMAATALFSGNGRITSISYSMEDRSANVTRITVGGQAACSPCVAGKEYPVQASGDVAIGIFAKEIALAAPSSSGMKRVFFEKSMKTEIDSSVKARLSGGWQPRLDSSVPSSFYGVDAPFHIHRVATGASHLLRLQWPWAEYTYLSAMPASLIHILAGASPQYAYKLWEILLFFLPVSVFYLFSRKLSRGRDAVFLFASLIYLFLPSQGMITGGGSDLFMYGMTAHTLATSLSLVSLLFAYEFAVEGKTRRFWPSLLFFVLAVASNQRIFMALAIGMGALLAVSAVVSRAREAVLLGIACAAAAAFLLAPFALNAGTIASYSVLGGASTDSLGWSLLGFFQLGYFILPLLLIAGMATAWARREMFLLFLFADSALVFAFATSPEANSLAPFLDGLRFMPSFFLPVFFISGAGALLVFEAAVAQAWKVGKRLGLDRLDTAVAFCLAILAPLAVFFASVALSTMDQYRDEAASPAVAAEYSELQAAYGIIGDGCVLVQGRLDVSQYTIYDKGFERSASTYADSAGAAVDGMERARCGYLLLGNSKTAAAAERTRWQEYLDFRDEPRLEEIAYGGSNRLFALKGMEPAAKVESGDARVDGYSFDYDRGSVQGECLAENCTLRIRQDLLPPSLACGGAAGCKARLDAASGAIYVSNIPRGKFDIALEPQAASWLYPLVAMGALSALICWLAAGKAAHSKPRRKLA